MATIETLARRGSVDGVDLATWIRRPGAEVGALAGALAELTDRTFCIDALEQVLLDAKYSGYVDRQARQIERFRRLEAMSIPPRIDYSAMPELRLEAREHLMRVAPRTLGQAARISGISPADVTVVWIYLTGRRTSRAAG
jgi:tRNA uridine 5-carboxymethylaminomethyl modification enzyme